MLPFTTVPTPFSISKDQLHRQLDRARPADLEKRRESAISASSACIVDVDWLPGNDVRTKSVIPKAQISRNRNVNRKRTPRPNDRVPAPVSNQERQRTRLHLGDHYC